MAKKSLKPKEEEAAIDMTPMLDVVFIMLIFFIVTTSFVKEAGIETMKPIASTAIKKPKANIFIGINEEGEVYMLKRKIEADDITPMIENMLLENPESTIVIQADMRSSSGVMLDVIDAAKKAGATNISVAAEN